MRRSCRQNWSMLAGFNSAVWCDLSCSSGGGAEQALMGLSLSVSGFINMSQFRVVKYLLTVTGNCLFFQENVRALVKGVRAAMGYQPSGGLVPVTTPNPGNVVGKPWKKHGNRNKKEKIRRITKHLEA